MSLRNIPQADEADQIFIDRVIKHGHFIQYVSDAIDEPTDEPAFAYSCGAFENYGAPELVVLALDSEPSKGIINTFMEEFKEGTRYRCGIKEIGLLNDDIPIVFLEAGDVARDEYATWADWYYEREYFPLWQIIWPTRDGLFPWDQGYPEDLAAEQLNLTGLSWSEALAKAIVGETPPDPPTRA